MKLTITIAVLMLCSIASAQVQEINSKFKVVETKRTEKKLEKLGDKCVLPQMWVEFLERKYGVEEKQRPEHVNVSIKEAIALFTERKCDVAKINEYEELIQVEH